METNYKKIVEIAKLSIEIGNNQTKLLKVYNNSIPSKLAYNFCLEYNLDYDSLKKLTYTIKNLIEGTNQNSKLNNSFEKKNKSVNHSPLKINEDNKKQELNKKEKLINNYENKCNDNKNKEINKSSYLNQTESSKNKIKNQKMKINKSSDEKEQKFIYNNDDIKIINIINNNNKKDNNCNNINYGEKLYDKCMQMKKISVEKIKNEINLQQKKELSECTFKPKINAINIKCFKNNINKKEEKKETKKSEQINIIKSEIEICKIKKEKMKKIQKRPQTARKEISIYERLYNLHKNKNKKEKNEINNKEILFKPKINNNYNLKRNTERFEERQRIYSTKSNKRKKILEQQIYTNYDSKTGQKLFHPSINKSKNYNIILYKKRQNKKLKKEIIKKEIFNMLQTQRIFRPNPNSDNIFENIIIRSFRKIFSILDINYKNEISIFNYSIKNIPDEIKKIIAPILTRIDLTNEIFNENKFIKECKKIFKNLDYFSKKIIYKFAEEENNEEQKDLYLFSQIKTRHDSEKDLQKFIYNCYYTNDSSKENEYNNLINNTCINQNINIYANDYCINGKYSRINERFYNYTKDINISKENRHKSFENLIIQKTN